MEIRGLPQVEQGAAGMGGRWTAICRWVVGTEGKRLIVDI